MTHVTYERLQDFIHRALAPEDDAAVYEHLEQCSDCRAEHDAETAVGERLRAYAAAAERDFPPTLKAAIWSEIRAARPSFWDRMRASFRPAIALPAAAVLAAGIYFGVANLSGHAGPSIEAAYYLDDHAAMNGTVPFSDRATPADLETSALLAPDRQTVAIEASSLTADAAR